MQNFHNILFVSEGLSDDLDALMQALSIARNNNAELRALLILPEFPKELARYREKYETSLAQHLGASIRAAREKTGVSETEFPVQIDVESGSTPAVRIIRQVLKRAHDLVIKEAERKEGGKGFRAMDMELLRKCPCPVWLSRPIGKHRGDIRVAVAIDPESSEPEGRDLSLRLLQLSRALADTCNGELNIISCWDYPLEEYLRDNSWIKMQEDELLRTVIGTQYRHRAALDDTILASGIGGKVQVQHLRGRADQIIPEFITSNNIDILVMGTVARTGIPGFVIGNTAENVVQKLECSLLASKPNGFVSPVKAY